MTAELYWWLKFLIHLCMLGVFVEILRQLYRTSQKTAFLIRPDDRRIAVTAPPLLPPGLFEIEILEGELYWRDAGKQILVPFTPDPDNQTPPTATVVLALYARITAIPAQLLENIELAIVGQLLTLPPGYWHSMEVKERSQFFYFDLPLSIPSGKHPIRLIATISLQGTGSRRESPPFNVCTARTYQQLHSYLDKSTDPKFQSSVPPVDRSQPPLSFTNQSGGIAAGSIGTININSSASDIKPQIIIGEPILLNAKTDAGYYQTQVPLKIISPFLVENLTITVNGGTLKRIDLSSVKPRVLMLSHSKVENGHAFVSAQNVNGDFVLLIDTSEPINATNPIHVHGSAE